MKHHCFKTSTNELTRWFDKRADIFIFIAPKGQLGITPFTDRYQKRLAKRAYRKHKPWKVV